MTIEALFYGPDSLENYLKKKSYNALEQIEKIPESEFLNSQNQEFADQIIKKHCVEPIDLHMSKLEIKVGENPIDGQTNSSISSRDFIRNVMIKSGNIVFICIPFKGDKNILNLKPNIIRTSNPQGYVRNGIIYVQVVLRNEDRNKEIYCEIEIIKECVVASNVLVDDYNNNLTKLIDKYFNLRKEILCNHRKVSNDLKDSLSEKIHDSLVKKANLIVEDRFKSIKANECPIQLTNEGNALIIHVVPINLIESDKQYESSFLREMADKVYVLESFDKGIRELPDGMVKFRKCESYCSYTHVSVRGTIESVLDSYELKGVKLTTRGMIEWIAQIVYAHIKFLESINAPPPFLLKVSYLGINNVKMLPSHYQNENLQLPSVVIPKFLTGHNYSNFLIEPMNFMWQELEFSNCPFFDENGYKYHKKLNTVLEKLIF